MATDSNVGQFEKLFYNVFPNVYSIWNTSECFAFGKYQSAIATGDDVHITLLEIKGAQVKLGIEAPAHISIHRREVYEKILEENLSSADVRVADLSSAASLLEGYMKEEQ